MKENRKRKNLQSSWWNRVIWGKQDNFDIEDDFQIIRKDIPPEDVAKHDDSYHKLRVVSPILFSLNKPQFSESAFNRFVVLKHKLLKQQGKYAYYYEMWNLVNASIKLSRSFQLIALLEQDYQHPLSQEFYQEISLILETTCDRDIFSPTILQKFNLIYRHINDNLSKKALADYQQECQKISIYGEWGLRVFRLHKQTQYSYIDTCLSLDNLVSHLSKNIKQLSHKYFLINIINDNYTTFSQLNSWLNLKETEQNHHFYGRMLQYLSLEYKYEENYQKFHKFLASLYEWSKHYKTILDIRNKYAIAEYKQPPSFLQEIKGEEIFVKYKSYLKNLRSI